jgi:hypothetical protein
MLSAAAANARAEAARRKVGSVFMYEPAPVRPNAAENCLGEGLCVRLDGDGLPAMVRVGECASLWICQYDNGN